MSNTSTLTGSDLKIATLKAWGCVAKKGSYGYWYITAGTWFITKSFSTEAEAWAAAPDVTTSLDACKPLIERMRPKSEHAIANREMLTLSWFKDKVSIIAATGEALLYAEGATEAEAICNLFLQFIELTKGGDTNAK